MKQTTKQYDVIVVGASVGGSTAAILFAHQGLRVALLERHLNINAYKKVCTHYIQPVAVPIMQRMCRATLPASLMACPTAPTCRVPSRSPK